jgi:hypothetical protein
MEKVPKKKIVSVYFSLAMFSLLDFWPLKIGPICCPETSVRNHHSMPYNISKERRSHMTIWWLRPWFCSVWSGSWQSGLGWSSSALQTLIYDNLTNSSAKFKGKSLSCIRVNTVSVAELKNEWSFNALCIFIMFRAQLWGSSYGYLTHRMLEPGSVLDALLHLGCTDSEG